MAERVVSGPAADTLRATETVSIHTRKIYDSCRDKDCIEDLRLYPDNDSQALVRNAIGVRARSAELLYSAVAVEEVSFKRGWYTVDVRNFYKVSGECWSLAGTETICGLAVFDKRCLLFGSDGSAKVFTSEMTEPAPDAGKPVAAVETVDPIVLSMRLEEAAESAPAELEITEIPDFIAAAFPSGISLTDEGRRVYVTLGQFSIVRLERDTQLVIPVYSYSMPDKECSCGEEGDPCDIFRRIRFPVDEFFPPDTIVEPEDYKSAL